MKLWPVFLLGCVVLLGCAPQKVTLPRVVPDPTGTESAFLPTKTATETETSIPPVPTRTTQPPTLTATPLPATDTPILACVTLIYEEYAQFEIISPQRERVLVDIHDPTRLSFPVSAADILLTTHTHWDHLNEEFQAAFPGPQLFVQSDVLDAPGVIIRGIASAHNQGDSFKPEGGSNYIYLIEIGALRIAHFGDIGQDELTGEQLDLLGQIDIAMMQLHNPYSEMNAENAKGIRLLDQVRPRLIIPTHLNLDTAKLAVARWPGWYNETPSVQICRSELSQGPQVLFLGEAAETMPKYLDLGIWGER